MQGLAWLGGDLYASEFGPDRDDEINRIVAGGNYGWPTVTGDADVPGLRDPDDDRLIRIGRPRHDGAAW